MDRQAIIETNRSLRNIKNELESLMEKGILNDADYEAITNLLPPEASLSGASAPRSNNATPVSSVYAPPKSAPPAYSQTGPPSLPARNQPPPPPAPTKPILAHARALYKYQGPDPRDVSFEKDDRIAVHEYMNADWWMGTNLRTGQEGIFPQNYVQLDEKSGPPQPAAPVAYQGPAAPVNPYNSQAPPMAVAQGGGEGSSGGGKMEQHGKKFGKKLGNAAIFGAGATIGSNIVNSIF
ncbi:related to SH3 domain protein [Cephalotrichum gorgonifer]|uniref:Related to SH3 domain protein n=1 Tax=Cephalotrichum gorgonifer TaxID=2041049 RepID=A0AAE8STH4_9PEZI|nr:related to SH3 domain protein [Cephalotrichum gorgonifer]